jgi:hypothetical protein
MGDVSLFKVAPLVGFVARWCSDRNSVHGISPESDKVAPLASGNNDFSFEHV